MFKVAVIATAFVFTASYRLAPIASAQSAMFSNWFKKEAAPASADSAAMSLNSSEKKVAALYGMYVADAVAMPVHWMYNLALLNRDYGQISGFVKPKDKFEGSILNLSNTGGGGRGSDEGDIVGTVILHGKKKYWLRGGNYHYHLGLEAGENTLEAQLCRVLIRSIVKSSTAATSSSSGSAEGTTEVTTTQEGSVATSATAPSSHAAPVLSVPAFTDSYIQFMRTPGSHNDTYASTAHRMFFANLVRGYDPAQCADNDGHNVDAIDALTLTVPVIIAFSKADRNLRNAKIREVMAVTRKSRVLQRYAEMYSDILVAVLNGANIREAIDTYDTRRAALASRGPGNDPMVACYIDSSFPAMLLFAYKYAESLEGGVLASANAGGENVARGALVGALLGAQHGMAGFPEWARTGLKNRDEILGEIQQLVALSE